MYYLTISFVGEQIMQNREQKIDVASDFEREMAKWEKTFELSVKSWEEDRAKWKPTGVPVFAMFSYMKQNEEIKKDLRTTWAKAYAKRALFAEYVESVEKAIKTSDLSLFEENVKAVIKLSNPIYSTTTPTFFKDEEIDKVMRLLLRNINECAKKKDPLESYAAHQKMLNFIIQKGYGNNLQKLVNTIQNDSSRENIHYKIPTKVEEFITTQVKKGPIPSLEIEEPTPSPRPEKKF